MRPALLALALAALAPLAAATHAATAAYDVAGPPVVGVHCQEPCLFVPGLAVGGVTFHYTNAEVPLHVAVADASGGRVPFMACQNLDYDAVCGEAGEPRVTACATEADLAGSAVPFEGARVVTVYVYAARAGCVGAGTSGTVTLTYGTRA